MTIPSTGDVVCAASVNVKKTVSAMRDQSRWDGSSVQGWFVTKIYFLFLFTLTPVFY